MESVLLDHAELEADPAIRTALVESGIRSQEQAEVINRELEDDPEAAQDLDLWLRGPEASKLRDELTSRITDYRGVVESSVWYKYGLSPNGNWKLYQLLTNAFLHGGIFHLFFNMVFFFAVAFSLEDLWGRALFSLFYVLAAAAAAVPYLIDPLNVPALGASGAIAATMGAFLVRLYKTKIKIAWCSIPLAIPMLVTGHKPFGVVKIPAYVFLPYWFLGEVLLLWWTNKFGASGGGGVGHAAHAAGFIFGLVFAGIIVLTKFEGRYLHPKIEAKVTFAAAPDVTQGLEMLDRGEIGLAERKLKSHLARFPQDLNAMLALIQVYQRTGNHTQLNHIYGRLIRHHLTNNDKDAALYAYDGLLSSFPDNCVEVRIAIRDWFSICEYLTALQMNREAAVEFERLATAFPEDALSLRACVDGGEAALVARDDKRAARLFRKAGDSNPPSNLVPRIESGLERCRLRLDNRPSVTRPLASPSERHTERRDVNDEFKDSRDPHRPW